MKKRTLLIFEDCNYVIVNFPNSFIEKKLNDFKAFLYKHFDLPFTEYNSEEEDRLVFERKDNYQFAIALWEEFFQEQHSFPIK